MEKVKIADEEDLVRDPSSRAVLNTNTKSLEMYRASRDRQRQIDKTIKDVEALKKDVGLIKDMLLQILENTSK